VLVPSGLWTAVNGALRPGVEALAAHLVGAGSRRGPPPRFYSWPLPPRYGGTQAATGYVHASLTGRRSALGDVAGKRRGPSQRADTQ
jgi:hypothetical protein